MLLWNYSVIHKSPGKFFGGNTVSNTYGNYRKNWQLRAIYSAESVPNQWWLPVGYYSWWMLPRTAGYVVAYSENQLSSTANPVMWINWDGTISIVLSALGNLSLVVSATGTCSIIVTATWELVWSIYGVGTSTITVSATGTAWANAFWSWVSTISLSATASISALGFMTGSMNPFTELSPEWLAQAVWTSLATQYASADWTMWKSVLDALIASSGGLTIEQAAQLEKASKALTLPKFIALQNP